jgi:DNA-binding SARP family transcriptional activator
MRGDERLRLLLAALEIADRGAYLPDVGSGWVDDRRQRLDELIRSARVEAAEAAFAAGQYAEATSIAEAVVAIDPYREAAWRLLMKVALVLGDHDRVIGTFRSCEQALAELGVEPEPTTVRLLRDSGR